MSLWPGNLITDTVPDVSRLHLIWEVEPLQFTLWLCRFFTGHTKDPDGTVQFVRGKTKVGDAIDGFVKIFTVAVSIVFDNI